MEPVDTGRLRRPTLVAAPLLVLALMGAALAVWLALWAMAHPDSLGLSFWVPFVVTCLIAVAGFVLSRGCFIDLRPEVLHDVVCWVTVARIRRESVVTVAVRPGPWRLFEVTLTEGTTRVLLGASPSQFPARLMEGSIAQDLSDIEQILGE